MDDLLSDGARDGVGCGVGADVVGDVGEGRGQRVGLDGAAGRSAALLRSVPGCCRVGERERERRYRRGPLRVSAEHQLTVRDVGLAFLLLPPSEGLVLTPPLPELGLSVW